MNVKIIKTIFFFILLIILTLFFYICYKKNQLGFIFLNSFDIRQVEVYEKNSNYYYALYRFNDLNIRITKVFVNSDEEGEYQKRFRIQRMKALFENAASPYPGELSDEIDCGDKYKPILSINKNSNLEIKYFTGFLNNRFQFGACTDDQAINKGIIAFFYCQKQKKFFQFEIFTEYKKFEKDSAKIKQIIESIKCQ